MQTIQTSTAAIATLFIALISYGSLQAETAADYPDPAQVSAETAAPAASHAFPEPRQVELEMARPAGLSPSGASATPFAAMPETNMPVTTRPATTAPRTAIPDTTAQGATAPHSRVQITTSDGPGGYLGISVSTPTEPLRMQLPDSLAKNQGLVVVWLAQESPAADDGIKMHDVLIEYDGQPIDNPETFFQRIQQQVPGQKIAIKLYRQSELIEVPVTVGEQPAGQLADRQQQQMLAARAAQQAAQQQAQAAAQNRPATRYYPGYPARPGMPNYPGAYRAPTAGAPYPYPYAQAPGAAMSGATPAPQAVPLNIAGQPSYPMRKKIVIKKEAWGDERNIWSDFYTDFTGDLWDSMINAPFDVGRMPGGWRAPSWSSPDPVTVGDAVLNQAPPFIEEAGNMLDFSD